MMEDMGVAVQRLIKQAEQRYRYADYSGGIELLKEALSISPDNGFLHSYLSFGLIKVKRQHAATHEAQIGLELAPQSPYAHFMWGNILKMKQKYKQALEFFATAISMEPENDMYHMAYGLTLVALGKNKLAEESLIKALELAPDDPDVLTAYADLLYEENNVNGAEDYYNEALNIEPQHIDALVGKGNVSLRKGDVEEAREHVLWALQQDPNDTSALHLLTSIKFRSNPVMGLWWRLNTWLVAGSQSRTILLLLGGYLLFNIASILLKDAGRVSLGNMVSYFWFGLVIYTWIGPTWFKKNLKAELKSVSLNNNF